ncbi:MAG: response regulator [Planctomycetes bacterium]|nr:response regulator [Planctomycetota bacterium]
MTKEEQLRTENAQLKLEVERFHAISASLKDWIWELDAETRFTYVSPSVVNVLGYTPEEMLGKSAYDFLHPEYSTEVKKHFKAVSALQDVLDSMINVNIHKDGSIVVLESSGKPSYNKEGHFIGYRGVDRDITARVEMEKALGLANERYRNLIENMPLGVSVFRAIKGGDDFEVIEFNSSCESMEKVSRNVVLNSTLNQSFPDMHKADLSSTMKLVYQDGRSRIHPMTKYHEGKIALWRECKVYRLPSDEIVVIISDETKNKQMEERIIEAQKDAEKALMSKSLFLSNMSHEMRTPLNVMLGFLELLKDTQLSHQQKEFLQTMTKSGKNLLILINDILDYSSFEEGQFRSDPRNFNLEKKLNLWIENFMPMANKKNLVIDYMIDKSVPPLLMGEVRCLKQIMINLISNAIKFTHEGEIRLKVYLNRRLEDGQWELKFEITDTGIGIAHEHQEAIFDRFSQVDLSLTRPYGGSGLGLSICRMLCWFLGGDIELKSEPGKGSTFSFTALFSTVKEDNKNGAYKVELPKELTHMKVLLAEDNEDNRILVETLLKGYNIKLISVINGKECLEYAQNNHVDLIIMDMQMPVMDGGTAIQAIRKSTDETLKKTPILGFSAFAEQKDIDHALAIGCDDYLVKPVSKKKLIHTLDTWSKRIQKVTAQA